MWYRARQTARITIYIIIFTMDNSAPKFSFKMGKRFGIFPNMRFPCDVYVRVISVRFKWIELWWSSQFVYL